MTESWREKLVPGARVKIVESLRGLFDDGVVLIVEGIEDEFLAYRYEEGCTIDIDGEPFDMSKAFGGGQCDVEAFGDGTLVWQLVQ